MKKIFLQILEEMGDVHKFISCFDKTTGKYLQTFDYIESTTLSAVYNVMAMEARPKRK